MGRAGLAGLRAAGGRGAACMTFFDFGITVGEVEKRGCELLVHLASGCTVNVR